MSKAPRIPGATPALPPAGDDLADLEDGGALPAVDPVQAQLAEMAAELRRLKRDSGQASKPTGPVFDAPSQEAAKAMADEMVAAGTRPRALLTPDGWYTHPEAARVPGSLGNVQTVQIAKG